MKSYSALVVFTIVVVAMLCALFSLSSPSPRNAEQSSVTRAPHMEASLPPADVDERDDTQGTVDLYGNDVSEAVAQYRLDATGSLYEVHSPQTEIPKLGSPKS